MEIAEGYFEPHSAFHDFLAVMCNHVLYGFLGGTLDMVGLFSYLVEGEIGRCSGLTASYCLLITSFTVKTSQMSEIYVCSFFALSFALMHPRTINRELRQACFEKSKV